MVIIDCPICGNPVGEININAHIDAECQTLIEPSASSSSQAKSGLASSVDQQQQQDEQGPAPVSSPAVASFFKPSSAKRAANGEGVKSSADGSSSAKTERARPLQSTVTPNGNEHPAGSTSPLFLNDDDDEHWNHKRKQEEDNRPPLSKRAKAASSNPLQKAAPLAERMRPRSLDEIYGQELVGPHGVLRGLIETDRVPSMILWGGAGTGKTTIARLVANLVGSRFVEINSTSSGVAECKKIFADARGESALTGRKTILFCDEIHRFSKSQQDVFLGPVESGQVTLIGATTENPSFKVQNALLSRCRTFVLQKLTEPDVSTILKRALEKEGPSYSPSPDLVNESLIDYLSAFADGDARTALNLLELAMSLSTRPGMTLSKLKSALTKTLVYDRAGDQHYDTISAFHKSIRGSDPDAALYYLARMLQSGEDALFIARRLVVVASEDVGLADNTMLSLATATYTAAEKIGMPEARINLAHATVALAMSKKSTRAYRGLGNAQKVLEEPGMAGLPIPVHLRNAPTRLMKELGYGKEYKYNPSYQEGRVKQEYLPERLKGSKFLEELDLGTEVDEELEGEVEGEDGEG